MRFVPADGNKMASQDGHLSIQYFNGKQINSVGPVRSQTNHMKSFVCDEKICSDGEKCKVKKNARCRKDL